MARKAVRMEKKGGVEDAAAGDASPFLRARRASGGQTKQGRQAGAGNAERLAV